VAVEQGILKTFSFSQIVNLECLDIYFDRDVDIVETIDDKSSTWLGQNPITVTLEVDISVAKYFLRRDLLPQQKILEHTAEKLLLSTQSTYEEELLRIACYWIPHITIVSPKYLQEKLEEGLEVYLKLKD